MKTLSLSTQMYHYNCLFLRGKRSRFRIVFEKFKRREVGIKIVGKQKSRLVINLNMPEKIEILNKTPWIIYGFHNFVLFTFSSAMEWSEDQNLALVREVLITEPYRFKARTTERELRADYTLKFPSKKFGSFQRNWSYSGQYKFFFH